MTQIPLKFSILIIFLILNSFSLVFGSFNVLDGQPSELLAFAQVPPILPQNSQKSPNLQTNKQLNNENPLISENSEGNERQFVPLVVNGHRLNNNPTNPIFVRVVPNNQSKVNEIGKQDDDQRTNIKNYNNTFLSKFAPNGDEIKEKINFEKKKEESTNPFSSLGSSTIEAKPSFNTKQEKQLQGKNEEKRKNANLNKPFIIKNEENKLEEKKREKKEEGNSNNKLIKEGKDNREKSEIPEEIKRENNKREEDNKGNKNKEEQNFPEKLYIKRNEKRGENKEKNEGNDLLIETWRNEIPLEGVKNWNK
ncbi:unnamed protein product [Meloidogyne enterolobii]|uniref:Uncharacterized protein n=1 Tax=Meloidogyne enterolobii TaxID=390850 RepID=A0ACB1AAY3_MELEN